MFGKRTISSIIDFQEQMDSQLYDATNCTGEFSKDNWDNDELVNGEYERVRLEALSEAKSFLKPVPVSELDCPKIALVGMRATCDIPNRYILRGEIYGMEGHYLVEHMDSGINRIAHGHEIYLIPPGDL